MKRRQFLSISMLGLSGLAGAVVTVPIVGYLLEPLIHPAPNIWEDLGEIGTFAVGKTVEVTFQDPSPLAWAGQTATIGAWLRRDATDQFTAFAVNCTHLGCPVSWLQDAGLFLCPCHGGVYYANGTVAAGPPPRPLFRYRTRVRNGRVQIHTRGLQVP